MNGEGVSCGGGGGYGGTLGNYSNIAHLDVTVGIIIGF